MSTPSTLIGNRPIAQARPKLTAAQKALVSRKVLPLNSLIHGDYYSGSLDDLTTVGRWNGQKRRFVFWDLNMGQPQAKAAHHVADLGTGPRFAPLAREESTSTARISDFALETTNPGLRS